MAEKRRDRCSVCLAEFQVKADGTIRAHGSGLQYCDGTGKPPAVMHDPLAPGGWAHGLIKLVRSDSALPVDGETP